MYRVIAFFKSLTNVQWCVALIDKSGSQFFDYLLTFPPELEFLQIQLSFNSRPTFATAQRTAMDLSVSRERAFL